MKDEIKEIISLLKFTSWCKEAEQIENCITNLQEENERLNNIIEEAIYCINLNQEESMARYIKKINTITDYGKTHHEELAKKSREYYYRNEEYRKKKIEYQRKYREQHKKLKVEL